MWVIMKIKKSVQQMQKMGWFTWSIGISSTWTWDVDDGWIWIQEIQAKKSNDDELKHNFLLQNIIKKQMNSCKKRYQKQGAKRDSK